MIKHTPGPWFYEYRAGDHPLNNNNGWGTDGLWDSQGNLILGSGPGWDGEFVGPKNPADKRLIAAAPELLEALKRITECDGGGVGSKIANDAIAKAEGKDL